MLFKHLRLELLILFGLLLGYYGRVLRTRLRNFDKRDTVILQPTLIERSVRQPHVRSTSKSPLSAPYENDDAQPAGICPDCGGVTEMYERKGESNWPDAWVENCTGCGAMVERPTINRLWKSVERGGKNV
jgi:hypothetical protein